MARIFLCASCTTLILVFCGNETDFSVLCAYLLLCFVPIYVVLVHNVNLLGHCLDILVFYPLLYPGSTSLWFLNLISWLLLQLCVTSLVACILVWLYVTSSHSYGYTLSSLWCSQSWYLLFLCVSCNFLDVSVTFFRCACLFMSRSNLFQNFGLCVSPYFKLFGLHASPHITYNP